MENSDNFLYGGRNSRSSSFSVSNLSASAPPFTVDRLNKNSFSDTRFHFSDSYYGASPFSEEWQYSHPSAPMSNLVMDSTGLSGSITSPNDYQFSGSASAATSSPWYSVMPATEVPGSAFGYGSNKNSSYSPSVPVFYGDHNMNYDGDCCVTSELAYEPSSFDLECGLPRLDGLGFHDDKYSKIVEPGRAFSSVKENNSGLKCYSDQLIQIYKPKDDFLETPAFPNNKYLRTESSTSSYPKFDDFSARSIASCTVGNMNKNLCLEEKHGSAPYYFSKTRICSGNSAYPDYGAIRDGDYGEFSKRDARACNPDSNEPWSVRKSSSGSVPSVRSCSRVTIRPPPSAPIGKTGITTIYHKAFSTSAFGCALSEGSYKSDMHKQLDFGVNPNKNDSSGTGNSNYSVKPSGYVASALEEIPDRFLLANDSLVPTVKSRVRPQVSDLDYSKISAISCNKIEAVKSRKDSSDVIEHQSLELDSPCWKGAPPSHFSVLDVEYGGCNLVNKALDECGDLELEHGTRQGVNLVDPTFITFEETTEITNINKNKCAVGAAIDDLYLRNIKNLIDDAKAKVDIPTLRSGEEFSDNQNMIDSMNDFELKLAELMESTEEETSVFAANDVSESATTAIHATEEEVLPSPVLQEDALVKLPDSKLNVATMIKALHNISELLLLNLSNDSDSLEYEYIDDVKKTILNLNSYLSKKSTGSGISELSDTFLPRNSDIKTCADVKSPYALSLRDTDPTLTPDDNAAKGIKKVLEKNFDFKEEMQTQASLFKDLWLEAEAKVCSLSYKANLNKMRIQMEETQFKSSPENEGFCSEEIHHQASSNPKLQTLNDPQKSSISSTSTHSSDIETSVMARFDILKARKETITETFENNPTDSLMDTISFMNSDDNSKSCSFVKGFKSIDIEPKNEYLLMAYKGDDSKFEVRDDVNKRKLNDSLCWDWEHIIKNKDASWGSS